MILRHTKMGPEGDPADAGGAGKSPIEVAAEQAVAAARAQAQAAEQKAETERVANAARIAALEAKLATPIAPAAPPRDPEVAAFMAKQRNNRRLEHLRATGLKTTDASGNVIVTEEEVLRSAPDVDPDEPDATAKYEAFRQSRPGLFKSPGQTTQGIVAAITPGLEELSKKSALFSGERLAASVFGGKR